MTSENLDLLIKILSAGVIASFVTGIFSVLTSIKTNKRLKEIELIKQRYETEKQKCDQLETYFKELLQNGKKFEYNGEIEHTFECVKKMFSLRIDMYEYIKKEHESHSFLFEDTENQEIQKYEHLIDGYIHDMVADFKASVDENKFVEYVNKIAISIDEFKENYYSIIKNKIKGILNK